jgi:vancomycin aglycone glucosyltransferase
MRVLLSATGSRGDVEPLVGLAVQSRALGAEVRVCAPPDKEFTERLAGWPPSCTTAAQARRSGSDRPCQPRSGPL